MSKTCARALWATATFAWVGTLQAHHGTTYFFDTSKVITLEGEVLRVEWTNPHRRLYIQSTNEKGDLVTWVLWGSANLTGPGVAELKERLQPGTVIVARAFPPRHSDRKEGGGDVPYPNGAFEVGAGEIRFPNGDVEKFGSAPTF
jgi:hypothetical protein